VSICNCSRARLVDSSRNCTFSRGYLNLMRSYGGLLELRGSKFALLKSTFNAENVVCWLSWSMSSDFDAVQSWNVCGSHESRKKSLKTPILGFKVVSLQSLGHISSHHRASAVNLWSTYWFLRIPCEQRVKWFFLHGVRFKVTCPLPNGNFTFCTSANTLLRLTRYG